jgi:ribosomal protein L19E
MSDKDNKIKVDDSQQNDFKKAIRRGVIMQLFKDQIISTAQYTKLMKDQPKQIQ